MIDNQNASKNIYRKCVFILLPVKKFDRYVTCVGSVALFVLTWKVITWTHKWTQGGSSVNSKPPQQPSPR